MQRVSMQLLKELEIREDIEIDSAVLHTSWKGIGFKTFLFLVNQYFQLPEKAKKGNADVILFSSMVTASLAYFIRNRVDIPMVTINHGKDVTLPVMIYQWFVSKVFGSLDGVISVSRATREACIERGMAPEKGVALGNGFDMERLKIFPDRQASREALKNRFNIDLEGRYMLLTVGRQVKRKGHEWFIRNVFPLLREDLVFVAVGDGPEMENIERAIKESSHGGRIFLLGRQPEEVLKQSYAAADLFVMPNIPVPGDMEGFGIVLLEANMAGVPAVASDLEGIKDVITEGKNGYRISPLDEQAFADAINRTLSNGLAEFSERTKEFVQHQFSWQHVADEYIEFITEILDRYQNTKNAKLASM